MSSPDPASALPSERQELFACRMAVYGNLNHTASEHYLAAGFRSSSGRTGANRLAHTLLGKEAVKERIKWLAAQGMEARQSCLRQAEDAVRDLLAGDENHPDDRPAPTVDLPSVKEVLEYTIAESRSLNERAKELNLTGNIRKRILALHGSATARLLTQIDRLLTADAVISDTIPVTTVGGIQFDRLKDCTCA